jgi:hypothetical protein
MNNSRLPSDTFAGLLNEMRAASTAGGGQALTTTAQVIGFPGGTSHVSLYARNFSTAVVAKVALNPYLLILKSADALASATDYSSAAQNNPVGTGAILSALGTLANGSALYVGSHVPFRGIAVDVLAGSVNANASVMTASYWNGSGWAATTGFTDGTASAGATFAQDGKIVWTVPSDWAKVQLSQTVNPAPQNPPSTPTLIGTLLPYNDKTQYWARISVSAALSATVIASTLYALNRSTAYAEMTEGSFLQFRTTNRPGGTSCVEVLTDAGTANLIANVYTDNPMGVFK